MHITRRAFMDRTLKVGGAATAVSLAPGGLERILAASRDMQGVPPAEAARDEVYWAQIQRAFAVDRGMINLNNGGVCPTPIYVHDALKRYLDVQNMTPSHWMWRYLDPEIETVRRRLARLLRTPSSG